MSEIEINKVVSKYRRRAVLVLGIFGLLSVSINWWLISEDIERRLEIGLQQSYIFQGFVWGAIIFGLFIVLWLGFYSMEKILVELNQNKNSM